MSCDDCPYAVWDYETFYNSSDKQWFVDGCRKGLEEDECRADEEE